MKEWVNKTIPTASQQVVKYIKETFNIEYTLAAVINLLHRIGFIYKKPKLVPGKANQEKQKQFLKELEKLKEDLQFNDKIIYMDGVHP